MPMMVEVDDAQGIILSAIEAIDHRFRSRQLSRQFYSAV